MMDKDGPVLIEVNCRPMGADLPADFLDIISGQHETDTVLDAYLKPKIFQQKLNKKYEIYAYGVIKHFTIPYDMFARSSPMCVMLNKLKAFYSTSLTDMELDNIYLSKTVDLTSTGGAVYLVHKDKYEVDRTLNFLRDVEIMHSH